MEERRRFEHLSILQPILPHEFPSALDNFYAQINESERRSHESLSQDPSSLSSRFFSAQFSFLRPILHCARSLQLVLVNILSNQCTTEKLEACLDTLLSLMLDSSANQLAFEACRGIEKIANLIKDENVDKGLRLKCGEFLLLLIGHISGRKDHTPLANIQKDISQLLGATCASLIWGTCHFGSNQDGNQQQNALRSGAGRLLDVIR